MPASDDRPVLTGLLALIGVGLVVGLVLGGAALAGTKVLGIGEDGSGGSASSGASMYLPEPSETETAKGPQVTLATDPDGEDTASEEPSPTEEESEKPEEITLSSGQSSVTPMDRIDLTGTYPGGEGAVLQVERFVDGSWAEFQVTAVVTNETFTTYVQTGRTGVNKFRMRDTESDLLSNEVTVRIG